MKSTKSHVSLPSAPITEVPAVDLSGFAGLANTDRAAREEIQHRAYSIWSSTGRPPHRELEHWLAAEAEVLSES